MQIDMAGTVPTWFCSTVKGVLFSVDALCLQSPHSVFFFFFFFFFFLFVCFFVLFCFFFFFCFVFLFFFVNVLAGVETLV